PPALPDGYTGAGRPAPERSLMRNPHRFTLAFPGVSEPTDTLADALFLAGCGDAALAGRGGTVCLHFERHAGTPNEAGAAAVRDVRKDGYDATLVGVE